MLQKETNGATASGKPKLKKQAAAVACLGGCEDAEATGKGPHPDHSRNLARIRRAQGQLEGVAKMIQERRYCPEILQQIRAAGAAIKGLEASVLELHFRGCIKSAATSKNSRELDQKIEEMMKLFVRE